MASGARIVVTFVVGVVVVVLVVATGGVILDGVASLVEGHPLPMLSA